MGWLKVREITETKTLELSDANVEHLPADAEDLLRLARNAQNQIIHYTAELERVQRALDERLQEIGMRAVTRVD